MVGVAIDATKVVRGAGTWRAAEGGFGGTSPFTAGTGRGGSTSRTVRGEHGYIYEEHLVGSRVIWGGGRMTP